MADAAVTEQERDAQRKYWLEHTPDKPTVETMMLDSKAADIDRLERPEVMALLGSVKGKRILELGAGIGRFTGELVRAGAAHVTALDFMEASIEENKRLNGHNPNVDFRVGDVTELRLPDASYDVVFTNWLLMYLGDKEVQALANSMLRWITPGGVIFFRESCFRQSGDKPRKGNPTHYRNPREYFRMFDAAAAEEPNNGGHARLELCFCKCVDTYVRLKRNQNQICWRWVKVVEPTVGASPSFRHFLDAQQYSEAGVAQYEAIYGDGYISCGGAAVTRDLAAKLELQAGQRVLDVGCGTGGSAYDISETYGVHVHGLDLSVNCLLAALERASTRSGDVTFEVADVATHSLPEASFDAVHCRDALLHVSDKAGVLARFASWLRPGGRLLITDYCTPSTHITSAMAQYVAGRKYSLLSAEQYGQAVAAAGFEEVEVKDLTDEFARHLQRELEGLHEQKDSFTARFGAEAFKAASDNWVSKLARAYAGQQRWVLITARKQL
uniref:phosphoethanolamine N-methyltransferase n=1 Tax=Chlamydomonas applanata TaxID=35704 RepID=A0A1W7HP20_CHLAP|nr:phosphoethanolamine-N-methyltransferase [Chlamydomonas applanata]